MASALMPTLFKSPLRARGSRLVYSVSSLTVNQLTTSTPRMRGHLLSGDAAAVLGEKLHIGIRGICGICGICTRQLNPSRDGVGGCVLRCTFADRPSMIALTSAAWRSSTGAASARYRRSICNFFSAHTWVQGSGRRIQGSRLTAQGLVVRV